MSRTAQPARRVGIMLHAVVERLLLWLHRADPHNHPLRVYLQGALVLVAIIPLGILACLNTYSSIEERDREARERLLSVASAVGTEVDDYVDRYVSSIESFALFCRVECGDSASLERALRNHHRVNDGFLTMILTDPVGRVRGTSPASTAIRPHTVGDRPYFQHAVKEPGVFVSEVFQGRTLGNDPIVAISAALRDGNGTLRGVVEGSLNLPRFQRFTQTLSKSEIQLLVLDERDRVVFSSLPEYRLLQSLEASPLLRAARASQAPAFRYSPGSSLVARAQSRRNWTVLISQPLAHVRRDVMHNLSRTLGWLATVMLLSILLARTLAWKVAKPLGQLLERVQRIEKGDIPGPGTVSLMAAPAEIVELNESVDQMSAQLLLSYQELRRAKEQLEDRVEQRTMELAEAYRALQAENIDRMKAQAKLILRDRAIAAASEGIIITDARQPGNPVIYVNSGFEKITGYSSAEAEGRSCNFLQGPATDPKTIAELRSAIALGQECSVEILNYRKDGKEFWNRLSITPIIDEVGRLTHYIGIQSDITHRKEIERLKTDLVATVSHELRTPLTSLRGFTELLLKNDYAREKQLRFLTIVNREATRLGDLINDFLDLQRIESGRQVYHLESTDLAGLIQETLRIFAETSEKHKLLAEIERSLPRVDADSLRIRQVLTNLVSNAIKFSPKGGLVTIGAGVIESSVVCYVTDEGIGIDPESMRHLFTRFFRADNTETRNIGGTGLGLELVKRIIEEHGGKVWAESEVGKGSTFYFALPVSVRNGIEPAPGPAPVGVSSR